MAAWYTGCAGCHTFGPIGVGFSPDLTTVGQRFRRADLVRAIVFQHEAVSDLYATDEITRRNGQKVTGIVRESGNNLVVGLAGNAEITIPLTDVQSRTRTNRSVMPEGLLASIDQNSQRALVAMLLAGTSSIPDTALARVNAGNYQLSAISYQLSAIS